MRKDRFTVAFDEISLDTMAALAGNTPLKEPPNYIRSSVSAMSDLLDAKGRRLTIVFRDGASGREWEYDPMQPGKAVPIASTSGGADENNVYRPSFNRRSEDEMVVGECAFAAEKQSATETAGAAELVTINGRRRKGR